MNVNVFIGFAIGGIMISIKDVAKESKVSIATVSRV
ncbi:MAG: LacI family DNA-binding transcriptional regulator, partial [Athalassotoga sp.]